MRVEINGGSLGAFRRSLEGKCESALIALAVTLVPMLQQTTSQVNPTKQSGVKYKRPTKSGAKTHTTYAHGSPVGAPPWKRTGVGQRSIGFQNVSTPGDPRVRVGVTAMGRHMIFHELGIKYSKAGTQQRPWLLTTVAARTGTLQQVMRSAMR